MEIPPKHNTFKLEHFTENLERLKRFIKKNSEMDDELVGVFDIGTKAGRLLVGRKEVPMHQAMWSKYNFFNDGQVFNLGSDFNEVTKELPIDSSALESIIYFINAYKKILLEAGVEEKDISIIGTAVFGKMKNIDEVRAKVKRETGIDLIVIDKSREAYISAFSIYHFLKIGRETFNEDDYIVLIDQGGSSTEISYFHPADLKGKHYSIDQLGTVALQQDFFTSSGDIQLDPATNKRKITAAYDSVEHNIETKVRQWGGFPELRGKNVKVFGMGSAISRSMPKGSSFEIHGSALEASVMEESIQGFAKNLERQAERINTLYSIVSNPYKEKRVIALEKKLVLLYGLPVYLKVMELFKASNIHFAGFGLRYGAYIMKYAYNIDLKGKVEESVAHVDAMMKEVYEVIGQQEIGKSEELPEGMPPLMFEQGEEISLDQYSFKERLLTKFGLFHKEIMDLIDEQAEAQIASKLKDLKQALVFAKEYMKATGDNAKEIQSIAAGLKTVGCLDEIDDIDERIDHIHWSMDLLITEHTTKENMLSSLRSYPFDSGKLSQASQLCLAAGSYLSNQLATVRDSDYSPAILQFCRALENELKDAIFNKLKTYISEDKERASQITQEISRSERGIFDLKRNINGLLARFVFFKRFDITLFDMSDALNHTPSEEEPDALNDYLVNEYLEELNLKSKVTRILPIIAKLKEENLRNKAAYAGSLEREDVLRCESYVCEIFDIWVGTN